MAKLFDLCVATRRFTDNNGNEKTAWENIGAIMEKEPGKPYMMLKAHFNPAAIQRKEGSESILVSMFKPKAKGNTGSNTGYNGDNSTGGSEFNPEPYDAGMPF